MRGLGVVTRHVADLPVLTSLLEFYDFKAAPEAEALGSDALAAGRIGLVPLKATEITQALESKRVDAVAIIASRDGRCPAGTGP